MVGGEQPGLLAVDVGQPGLLAVDVGRPGLLALGVGPLANKTNVVYKVKSINIFFLQSIHFTELHTKYKINKYLFSKIYIPL